MKYISVAVDGPAGAGKSSVSKAVAKSLGYTYIDTGAMYRAVALFAINNGIDAKNETEKLVSHLNEVEIDIKYTDDGGKVKVVLDSDHQNAFITVSDTGIGMAEEELGKIFQRFYRIDKTRNRETGGTGLGLSITHSTVLMHNGSIKVTSRENEGTTFVVRIPLIHNA